MARNRAGSVVQLFDGIQTTIRKQPRSPVVTELFRQLGKACLEFLLQQETMTLTTNIHDKTYFSFKITKPTGDILSSRSVNQALFGDMELVNKFLNAVRDNSICSLTSEEINNACYTLVISFACTVDLTNPGDKKTPGTYWEYLVTHLFTCFFNTNPSEKARIQVGEEIIPLTVDLIIDPGENLSKFHFAIKTSTRERASEFWAHQRILNIAGENGPYTGVFIGLAETKLDHKTYEVVEICVPDQWRAYQEHVSHISGVYYLDPPNAYLRLNEIYPFINVWTFGDFFFENEPYVHSF